jgi:hypothetical protein
MRPSEVEELLFYPIGGRFRGLDMGRYSQLRDVHKMYLASMPSSPNIAVWNSQAPEAREQERALEHVADSATTSPVLAEGTDVVPREPAREPAPLHPVPAPVQGPPTPVGHVAYESAVAEGPGLVGEERSTPTEKDLRKEGASEEAARVPAAYIPVPRANYDVGYEVDDRIAAETVPMTSRVAAETVQPTAVPEQATQAAAAPVQPKAAPEQATQAPAGAGHPARVIVIPQPFTGRKGEFEGPGGAATFPDSEEPPKTARETPQPGYPVADYSSVQYQPEELGYPVGDPSRVEYQTDEAAELERQQAVEGISGRLRDDTLKQSQDSPASKATPLPKPGGEVTKEKKQEAAAVAPVSGSEAPTRDSIGRLEKESLQGGGAHAGGSSFRRPEWSPDIEGAASGVNDSTRSTRGSTVESDMRLLGFDFEGNSTGSFSSADVGGEALATTDGVSGRGPEKGGPRGTAGVPSEGAGAQSGPGVAPAVEKAMPVVKSQQPTAAGMPGETTGGVPRVVPGNQRRATSFVFPVFSIQGAGVPVGSNVPVTYEGGPQGKESAASTDVKRLEETLPSPPPLPKEGKAGPGGAAKTETGKALGVTREEEVKHLPEVEYYLPREHEQRRPAEGAQEVKPWLMDTTTMLRQGNVVLFDNLCYAEKTLLHLSESVVMFSQT